MTPTLDGLTPVAAAGGARPMQTPQELEPVNAEATSL
jgi:hypothetical protein